MGLIGDLICMNCGTEIEDHMTICPECGEDVSPETNDQEFWECSCGCEPGMHLDECPDCGTPRS